MTPPDHHHPPPATISVVVAANNQEVLRSSLLASPDLDGSIEVIVEPNPPSASQAYNAGLDRSHGELVVFPHQDVYFPPGWKNRLRLAAHYLDQSDPNWAVLGVFGLNAEGKGVGRVYSTGLQRTVGTSVPHPVAVQSLDEVVLVLRRSSGLRFDDALPGFHLYGTDICLEARRKGRQAYAFEGHCVRNSNGIKVLPDAYWSAWRHMRTKWKSALPVVTPCMPITRSRWTMIRYQVKQPVNNWMSRARIGMRIGDPAALWSELSKNQQP